MIPKIIHYCWFGRGEMPSLALKCIESWKKHMPDYEIKRWDEETFDIQSNTYVKEAYENRKFAFVTDYVRLYALYMEGGIYMDTDVEVLKSLTPFLHLHAFSGFESSGYVPTGMMASEKGGTWVKELLRDYDNRHFVNEDNTFDLTTNTTLITNYMLEKGLIMNNSYQDFENLTTMYPSEYFCPISQNTGKLSLTENSYCIHHFAGSWMPKHVRVASKIKKCFSRILGPETINKIIKKIGLREWKEKQMK